MGGVHNELTGRAGFIARALRNALQIEDPGVALERVSETLQPTFDLWAKHRPEFSLLRGERLFGVAPSQPAVAGEFGQVGIFNPAGSGLIVIVTDLLGCLPGAGVTVEVQLGANVAFTATSTPNSRDSRTALLTGVQCGSFANHAAARIGSGALITAFGQAVVGYLNLPINVVLHPGFFLAVGPNIVNTSIGCSFVGYERPAFAGELTARA